MFVKGEWGLVSCYRINKKINNKYPIKDNIEILNIILLKIQENQAACDIVFLIESLNEAKIDFKEENNIKNILIPFLGKVGKNQDANSIKSLINSLKEAEITLKEGQDILDSMSLMTAIIINHLEKEKKEISFESMNEYFFQPLINSNIDNIERILDSFDNILKNIPEDKKEDIKQKFKDKYFNNEAKKPLTKEELEELKRKEEENKPTRPEDMKGVIGNKEEEEEEEFEYEEEQIEKQKQRQLSQNLDSATLDLDQQTQTQTQGNSIGLNQ